MEILILQLFQGSPYFHILLGPVILPSALFVLMYENKIVTLIRIKRQNYFLGKEDY
jgi:hypothetical protein